MNDLIFCTLFDSNYLDKGIALYNSMLRVMDSFKLYIFAFDEKSEEILRRKQFKNVYVIGLKEFETPELLAVKAERTRAEYCWTCSSWTIRYVLEKFKEHICTYIDADMKFFSNPQVVFDEMRANGNSIIVVPHRYATKEEERKAYNTVGVYCVEFNTFVNDENGRTALKWWSDSCLKWCSYAVPGTTEWYGDQKYLNVFPEKFKGVTVCNHFGVGLAPWNIHLVEYYKIDEDGVPVITIKSSSEHCRVVLYHFENVGFITPHILHASSRTKSKKLFECIYKDYINEIIAIRNQIETEFSFKMSRERRVVSKNWFMKLYQKYISPFRRVKKFSDLFWVK